MKKIEFYDDFKERVINNQELIVKLTDYYVERHTFFIRSIQF